MASNNNSSRWVNFGKGILLVIVAILALKLLGGVVSAVIGIVITAVIVLVIGALIYGLFRVIRR